MRVMKGWNDEAVGRLIFRSHLVPPELERAVAAIVGDVKQNGAEALLRYAKKFDNVNEDAIEVEEDEIQSAMDSVSSEFLRAVEHAARNIRQFAEWQMPQSWMREIEPGVQVGQKVVPLRSVGCYVPSGRHPLPSSLLMTVIPARVAGVREIYVASPRPSRELLAAAGVIGIRGIFRIGGAHAIAAFAYGAALDKWQGAPIERVDKICGPGNAYVTAAKKMVSADCPIDMPAGPTEILYLAEDGDARFIASDLVAQAEHDPDALALLVTSNASLANEVEAAVDELAADNPIAKKSLASNGYVFLAESHSAALSFANTIGAEHVTINRNDLEFLNHAGSIFVGPYSAQSLGDYVSGPNHVLPTGNVARYRGGLSVMDFLKIITVQEVSKAGLKRIGPTAITLAEAEGLKAHAESVRVRLR